MAADRIPNGRSGPDRQLSDPGSSISTELRIDSPSNPPTTMMEVPPFLLLKEINSLNLDF
jgi:hypothetical protein